jgi:hypothetical protein
MAPRPTTADVEKKAERFHRAQDGTLAARGALDASIFAAKRGGATFREIAKASGMSVAWCQVAIERAEESAKALEPS